jgi:hypothetical protein
LADLKNYLNAYPVVIIQKVKTVGQSYPMASLKTSFITEYRGSLREAEGEENVGLEE